MSLVIVVEGDTDLPVVRKLASDAGLPISAEIDCQGKGKLDRDLPGYNSAARGSPWFVLRDLDQDAPCAPTFLAGTAVRASPWMCFRLAVREVESWLLADTRAMARFLRVDEHRLPRDPDSEPDPTRTLVNLARQSRSPGIRKALVPRPGTSTVVGPLYEAKLIEFGHRHWRLEQAVTRSRSLEKSRDALRALAKRWNHHQTGKR